MSLINYKKKRSFKQTPEPEGGASSESQLRFVIQKHAASHLHYDFRLEMEGVLKSWAVPKGPSMDTRVKRLAMMVEDHPFDYRTFEGVIPTGNYGAGTVMVWDEGYYKAADADGELSKKEQDKELRHELHQGKIKFELHGKKLKGLFALVKASGRGENSWLLMKLSDKYATEDDILLKDRSVISKRTLNGIAGHPAAIYGRKTASDDSTKKQPPKGSKGSTGSGSSRTSEAKVKRSATARSSVKRIPVADKVRPAKAAKKTSAAVRSTGGVKRGASARTKGVSASAQAKDEKASSKGETALRPSSFQPMLATLVDKPFHEEGWVYEVKWDGYRALSMLQGEEVQILSRNAKSFNEKFYPIHKALKRWNIRAAVDGEIVVLDERGLSNFSALQNWRSEADGHLIYYVFDLLWLDGADLTTLPLVHRKELLKEIMPRDESIRFSETFVTSGTEIYAQAEKLGLEGIIAKRADSLYASGKRTSDWLKIKVTKRQEVVIGGYTRNEDSSKLFSSLLVGVHEGKSLVYTGKVGTGFTDQMQKDMMKMFKLHAAEKSPFDVTPDVNKPSRFRPDPPHARATWLKPELICEVSFTEMTSDGVMRHPSFEGMRDDKKASSVVREKEVPVEEIVTPKKPTQDKKSGITVVTPVGEQDRKTLLNPTEETQVKSVKGHDIKFTNLSKIYWPDDHVTKRDMINYYYQIAPYILPYLKDRPQSLNRFPNGIKGKSFYQKDVTGKVPDWVDRYLYHSSDSAEDKHFMVPKSEADLLLMATMGCIEMNPWSSTIETPDHPDWCIIDLDPDKNSFNQVIEAARVTKQVLDEIGAASYCKTSGSTGLHIYMPLGAKYTYEESKEFARAIVKVVHKLIPKFTSIERAVSNRGGRMYLDFLQNRPQATLAAPYSLRPKPGATVSMPLHWEEVKAGLTMKDFTISNAVERVRSEGDLFKPVLGKAIDLNRASKKLSEVNGA